MSRLNWGNIILTILIITTIYLTINYITLSKEVPYKVIIIKNESELPKIINTMNHKSQILEFKKNEYSPWELSKTKNNLLINIYQVHLNNTTLFVLSPENSLYFTTALGNTVILEQTSDYAIIYTKDFPLFSYDNRKFELIPGFNGLYLLIKKDIMKYYTYTITFNNTKIVIENKETNYKKEITGIKMRLITIDNIKLIAYYNKYKSLEQIILPSKPFSIIHPELPEKTMFIGLTSNGKNTLTFHFLREETVQYFMGMINTYGVLSMNDKLFFIYSGFD